ncbi:MAG: phosphatase PAP2 family protein [Flavobacteriales bacterium]
MLSQLIRFDEQLFLWLNGFHSPGWDRIMWLFSTRWFWVPVYAVLLAALFRRYGSRMFLRIVVVVIICVTINDQLASGIFKPWVARPRPTYTEGISHLVHTVTDLSGNPYRGGRFGFYSSHTANLFGVAVLYLLLMRPNPRWVAPLIYLWVTTVAYSRIYLGVHFPLDILTGMAMGTMIGWLCFVMFNRYLLTRSSSA